MKTAGIAGAIAAINPTIAAPVLALATVCGICRFVHRSCDKKRDEELRVQCLDLASKAAQGTDILDDIANGKIKLKIDVGDLDLIKQDITKFFDVKKGKLGSQIRQDLAEEFEKMLAVHPQMPQILKLNEDILDKVEQIRILAWTQDHRGRMLDEYFQSLLPDRSLTSYTNKPWRKEPSPFLFHYTKGWPKQLRGDHAKRILAQFNDFLNGSAGFCWWLWTGLEGAGKSRLAMDACRLAETNGWNALFLLEDKLPDDEIWSKWKIDQNTLLVFDYAGSDPKAVRVALSALSGRLQDCANEARVRVLLLERFVGPLNPRASQSELPQWAVDIFKDPKGHESREAGILNSQYPEPNSESEHIGDLTRTDMLALANEYIDDQAGDRTERERKAVTQRLVALLGDSARPLHVQLATYVLLAGEQPRNFEEVMRVYMERVIKRWREGLHDYGKETATKLLNLLCVATVMRGLRFQDVPSTELLPDSDALLEDQFLSVFGSKSGSQKVSAVEPDLIGEWFVRVHTQDGRMSPSVLTGILRDIPQSTRCIRDFVQRTYRYFHTIPLWQSLRQALGRYSTPFGEVFDDPIKQALLLGGSTKCAETTYHDLVVTHIDAALAKQRREDPAHEVVVIDLMAGGSNRVERLLDAFRQDAEKGRLFLVAIDCDESRLVELGSKWRQTLFVERQRIDGSTDLPAILKHLNLPDMCDLVIAKKALHELPWDHQRALIAQIGRVVRPGGTVVMYTDSPDEIDERGVRRWLRLLDDLRRLLPIDMDSGFDVASALSELIPPNLVFEADNPSHAAQFANLWIKLKDWANFNAQEWEHRYFSSWSHQLREEFQAAGFDTESCTLRKFAMQFQGARFVEEAINRIGYLYADRSLSNADIEAVFSENDRYELCRDFGSAHLWDVDGPSQFGASVGAIIPQAFDLNCLVGDQLRACGLSLAFPQLEGPSFDMPVHVFALTKR